MKPGLCKTSLSLSKAILMKRGMLLFSFISQLFSVSAQKNDFSHYPVYNGNDLGLSYSSLKSVFRIWAPVAGKAELILYNAGIGDSPAGTYAMQKNELGVWSVTVNNDLKGKYYAFRVLNNNKWSNEVPDPYAKAVGVNGQRGMIIDLNDTDPAGWEQDQSPSFKNPTDAIIYELHIRDASIAASSGIMNKGKFLGLTEPGTKNGQGLSTGLDHLKELGVTHIHLLPFFDFSSIDETKPGKPQYNWGYDPLNYNTTEGSYASNAYDGTTRIKEFKQLVKTFHQNGLRVVMDVVYNHTSSGENSNFNQLVPGYYYRQAANGKFSNATACGNETASERPMMRKFILESMKYWVQEYHIDGFRIDLMGVHDITTMNLISKELHKIRPGILLYGEGWTAGESPLPDSLRALKRNAARLDHIAVFSDDIRDGIKGSVFRHEEKGFVSGKPGMEESIKFGIVAACKHPQVDYKKVNYSKAPYAAEPYQVITYAECHDNHALWDKLAISAADASAEDRKKMHKLALAIVLTSQGIPFLHAGTEFLRTKKGVDNSFDSPDSINEIDWDLKTKNADVVKYVEALIKLRKQHPAFRMMRAKEISGNIRFMKNTKPGIVAYTIDGAAMKDPCKKIMVILNGSGLSQTIQLPVGAWKILFDEQLQPANPNETPVSLSESMIVNGYHCTILYQ
jgi:pullulanase